ncbi:type III secretion system protein SctP [Paraburkholderia acidisoli]|uniref:Type III secretion protein n=1 Tax=Paraburkholderia acidisoli TaxID=2571748 RepID=A0A7Z2GQP3_9BURK|nr:type III secretion system protein SctP [Paraburkholderia acidisoli]QGZ65824.1 type III secretion protein [Paraburkholderia acidisoli]
MTKLHRPARIIAPLPGEQEGAPPPRARRVDYAALLRRARVPDPAHDDAPTHDRHDPDDEAFGAPEDDDARHDTASERGGKPREAAMAERIGSVCSPIVDAVYRQQARFIDLTGRIAREVAAFCANRAISGAGNWEMSLALDPRILPATTLHLALSPRCLQLRFETQDTSSRQLLLQHTRLLERELTTLLDAWGEPRELDIGIH